LRSPEKYPTDSDRARDAEDEFRLEPGHARDIRCRNERRRDAAKRGQRAFRRAHLPSDAQHRVVGWRVGGDRLEARHHGRLTALAKQGTPSAVGLDFLGNVAMRHHHETHSGKDRGIVTEGTQLLETFPACSRAELFDDPPTKPTLAIFSIHDEGPYFRHGVTERRQFGTPDNAPPKSGNDEPIRVLRQLRESPRQQAPLDDVTRNESVERGCISWRRFAEARYRAGQGWTAKLANCQRSDSFTGGVPHFANKRDRLSKGVQVVWTDGHGPKYGSATSRISR
jgi:hypothetical protein